MVSLLGLRAAVLSLLLFGLFIGVWHLATAGTGTGTTVSMDPEYAKLVGASASQGKSAMPGPAEVGAKIWEHLKNPFYDRGSNDKGVEFNSHSRLHAWPRVTSLQSRSRYRSDFSSACRRS